MRHSFFGAFLLVTVTALALRAQDPPPPLAPPPPPALDTLEKKVGYALGVQVGTNLRVQGALVDPEAMARGLRDGMGGIAPIMSDAAMQEAVKEFQLALQAKAQKARTEQSKKNKDDGAAFLAKNKTVDGVQATQSGLQYKVIKAGNGQKPTAASTVTVQYEGTLTDGTVFDSSYKRGQPSTFALGQVIRGWTEGLQLMDVGSTYILYIPPELGYGETPPPGPIGANAVLVFKIELLEIKK